MAAMPAVKWPEIERKEDPVILAKKELDQMISKVAAYRELVFEYPMTMVYRGLLEEAQKELKEAEKKRP